MPAAQALENGQCVSMSFLQLLVISRGAEKKVLRPSFALIVSQVEDFSGRREGWRVTW